MQHEISFGVNFDLSGLEPVSSIHLRIWGFVGVEYTVPDSGGMECIVSDDSDY